MSTKLLNILQLFIYTNCVDIHFRVDRHIAEINQTTRDAAQESDCTNLSLPLTITQSVILPILRKINIKSPSSRKLQTDYQ